VVHILAVGDQDARLAILRAQIGRGNEHSRFRRTVNHVLRHRANHDRRTEQELVVDAEGPRILRKIHGQAAHDRLPFACDLPGLRVDVRHQAVAPPVGLHQGIGEFTEFPDFARPFGAVGPEDGTEGTQLEHARVEFLVGGFLDTAIEDAVVAAQDEAANIEGPVGDPCH